MKKSGRVHGAFGGMQSTAVMSYGPARDSVCCTEGSSETGSSQMWHRSACRSVLSVCVMQRSCFLAFISAQQKFLWACRVKLKGLV